jgi:hypothetical protein
MIRRTLMSFGKEHQVIRGLDYLNKIVVASASGFNQWRRG